MSNELDLREMLTDVILEMYGLSPTPPETPGTTGGNSPGAGTPRAHRHPTFSRGTAPKPGRFKREGSAIPLRQKILVGTSMRLADKKRPGPGARMPGESDRDFIQRRGQIRRSHALGLAPPKSDVAPTFHNEAWEMGH